jgi:hypothetical protein
MGEAAASGILALAGDIIAASATFSGFLLVYLGALATEYSGFSAVEKKSVRGSFQSRAWFAAASIIFSILACAAGCLAKWQAWDFVAGVGLILLATTLFLSVVSAALMALEIK